MTTETREQRWIKDKRGPRHGPVIITKDGKMIRIESSAIRQAGRSTQGVRLVRMEDTDSVAAASVIPETENGNGNGNENGSNGEGQGDLPLQ